MIFFVRLSSNSFQSMFFSKLPRRYCWQIYALKTGIPDIALLFFNNLVKAFRNCDEIRGFFGVKVVVGFSKNRPTT